MSVVVVVSCTVTLVYSCDHVVLKWLRVVVSVLLLVFVFVVEQFWLTVGLVVSIVCCGLRSCCVFFLMFFGLLFIGWPLISFFLLEQIR